VDDRWFIGGMNVELPFLVFRRYGAMPPFARLHIDDDGLWIGTTVPFIPKKSRSLAVTRQDIVQVFRSRGMFSWGVGIETVESKTHFFWTFNPRSVLDELMKRGYAVGNDRIPGSIYLMGLPRPWGRRRGQPAAPSPE